MPKRNLPNLDCCKTKPFGSKIAYLCCVELPYTCKYSFQFNKQNFCNHPQKEKLFTEEKFES